MFDVNGFQKLLEEDDDKKRNDSYGTSGTVDNSIANRSTDSSFDIESFQKSLGDFEEREERRKLQEELERPRKEYEAKISEFDTQLEQAKNERNFLQKIFRTPTKKEKELAEQKAEFTAVTFNKKYTQEQKDAILAQKPKDIKLSDEQYISLREDVDNQLKYLNSVKSITTQAEESLNNFQQWQVTQQFDGKEYTRNTPFLPTKELVAQSNTYNTQTDWTQAYEYLKKAAKESGMSEEEYARSYNAQISGQMLDIYQKVVGDASLTKDDIINTTRRTGIPAVDDNQIRVEIENINQYLDRAKKIYDEYTGVREVDKVDNIKEGLEVARDKILGGTAPFIGDLFNANQEGLLDIAQLKQLEQKLANGEKLTTAETARIVLTSALETNQQIDRGWTTRVAEGTPEALKMMGEMAATYGIFSAAQTAVRTTGVALTKKISYSAAKEIVEAAASETGKTWIRTLATKGAKEGLKQVMSGVAVAMVAEIPETIAKDSLKIATEVMNNNRPVISFSDPETEEEFISIIKNDEEYNSDWVNDLTKAFARQYFMNTLERGAGEVPDAIITEGADKLKGLIIAKYMSQKGIQTLEEFSKVYDAVGLQGIFGEVFEEYAQDYTESIIDNRDFIIDDPDKFWDIVAQVGVLQLGRAGSVATTVTDVTKNLITGKTFETDQQVPPVDGAAPVDTRVGQDVDTLITKTQTEDSIQEDLETKAVVRQQQVSGDTQTILTEPVDDATLLSKAQALSDISKQTDYSLSSLTELKKLEKQATDEKTAQAIATISSSYSDVLAKKVADGSVNIGQQIDTQLQDNIKEITPDGTLQEGIRSTKQQILETPNKQYYVQEKGKFKEIKDAKSIKIINEADTFIYRDPESKLYQVVEAKSGMAIAEATTRSAAVEQATARLNKMGLETFQSKIQEVISKKGISPRYIKKEVKKETKKSKSTKTVKKSVETKKEQLVEDVAQEAKRIQDEAIEDQTRGLIEDAKKLSKEDFVEQFGYLFEGDELSPYEETAEEFYDKAIEDVQSPIEKAGLKIGSKIKVQGKLREVSEFGKSARDSQGVLVRFTDGTYITLDKAQEYADQKQTKDAIKKESTQKTKEAVKEAEEEVKRIEKEKKVDQNQLAKRRMDIGKTNPEVKKITKDLKDFKESEDYIALDKEYKILLKEAGVTHSSLESYIDNMIDMYGEEAATYLEDFMQRWKTAQEVIQNLMDRKSQLINEQLVEEGFEIPKYRKINNDNFSTKSSFVTADDVVNIVKKYKNYKELEKDYMILYHGGQKEIIGGKLVTGGRIAGDTTEENLGRGTDMGGIFFTPEKDFASIFTRWSEAGAGKVHTFLVKTKEMFDVRNPQHYQKLKDFVGKTYKDIDGEDLVFTEQMLNFMVNDGIMDWATFDSSVIEALGFKGVVVTENSDYDNGKPLMTYVLFEGGRNSDHYLIPDEIESIEDLYKEFTSEMRYVLDSKELNEMDLARMKKISKEVLGDENVEILESILTPSNMDAMGRYMANWIQIRAGSIDKGSTFYHEAVHKALDIFLTPQEKALLIKEVRKSVGDEKLIEMFGDTVANKKFRLDSYEVEAKRLYREANNKVRKVGIGLEAVVKNNGELKKKENELKELARYTNISIYRLSGAALKQTTEQGNVKYVLIEGEVNTTHAYALLSSKELGRESNYQIVDISEVIGTPFMNINKEAFNPSKLSYSKDESLRSSQREYRSQFGITKKGTSESIDPNIYTREEVANYLTTLGTHDGNGDIEEIGMDDYLITDMLYKDKEYELVDVDVEWVFENNPDIAKNIKESPDAYLADRTYIEDNDNYDSPIIIGSDGEIIDGTGRLTGHYLNGDEKITAYVGVEKDAKYRGEKETSLDDMAEEWLAENIIKYINKNNPKTFKQKIKATIDKFIDRWFKTMDNIDTIENFYKGLLSGRLLKRQRELQKSYGEKTSSMLGVPTTFQGFAKYKEDISKGILMSEYYNLVEESKKYKTFEDFKNAILPQNNNFPNILYHGTNEEFDMFKSKEGKRSYGIFGEEIVKTNGMFLTVNKEYAKNYGKNVVKVYPFVKNPLIGISEAQYGELTDQKLKDANYIFEPIVEWDTYEDGNGNKKESAQIGTDMIVYEQDYTGNKELPLNWINRFIGEDGGIDWRLLDNPEVTNRLVEKGYDGLLVQEDDGEGLSYFVPLKNKVYTESLLSKIWDKKSFSEIKYRAALLFDEEAEVEEKKPKNEAALEITKTPEKGVVYDTKGTSILPSRKLQQQIEETLMSGQSTPATRSVTAFMPVIETSGKIKDSRAFEKIQDRYSEIQELDPSLNELKYKSMSIADITAKAMAFVDEYPAESRRVALGMELAPEGTTNIAVSLAYTEKMFEEGKWKQAREADRALSLRGTRLGQEIVSFKGRLNANSPMFFMEQVLNARRMVVSSRMFKSGSLENFAKMKQERMAEVAKTLKQIKLEKAEDFINKLIC